MPPPSLLPRQKVALTPRHSPMDWANLQRQAPTLVTSAAALEAGFQRYTLADLKKHNREEDCWIGLSGRVYDVTRFLAYHPGGKKIVMSVAGKDATQKFSTLFFFFFYKYDFLKGWIK